MVVSLCIQFHCNSRLQAEEMKNLRNVNTPGKGPQVRVALGDEIVLSTKFGFHSNRVG